MLRLHEQCWKRLTANGEQRRFLNLAWPYCLCLIKANEYLPAYTYRMPTSAVFSSELKPDGLETTR